jgi:hypothetical protein
MAQKRITDLAAATALTGNELVEVSQLSEVVTITGATISATAADNSFSDSAAGFIAAGFAEGDRVSVSGFATGANNLFVGILTAVAAGKIEVAGTDGDAIVNEAAGAGVTISKWISRRATAQEIADLAEATGGTTIAVNDQADSYTAILGDANDYVRLSKATAVTFTIPTNAAVAYPVGTRLYVEQGGAGVVTIAGAVGVTVQSRGAVYDTAGQHAVAVALKVAANIWTVSGDLA